MILSDIDRAESGGLLWYIKDPDWSRKRERHDQWRSQRRHSHNPSILIYTVSKQQSISLKEGELILAWLGDRKVCTGKIMLLDLTFLLRVLHM